METRFSEFNEDKQKVRELKDLVSFASRPKTAAWRASLPEFSEAVVNWFVNDFERDVGVNAIFGPARPAHEMQAYLIHDDDDDVSAVLQDLVLNPMIDAGFEVGRGLARPGSVLETTIGYMMARFIDPPLYITAVAPKRGLVERCTSAAKIALEYLLDADPTEDDVLQMFEDYANSGAAPTVQVANGIDPIFISLSLAGNRRPRLYFFRHDGGAWSALFVKSKKPTQVPPVQPVIDLEEDVDNDNAGPDYDPRADGVGVGGVPRAGPRRTIGTKLEVWRGIARRTKGGLTKAQLMRNRKCRIVSRQASASASLRYARGDDDDNGPSAMSAWRMAVAENRRFPFQNALRNRRVAMAVE
jgi:hypothetical protein